MANEGIDALGTWCEGSYTNSEGKTVVIRRKDFFRIVRSVDAESGRYIDTPVLGDIMTSKEENG